MNFNNVFQNILNAINCYNTGNNTTDDIILDENLPIIDENLPIIDENLPIIDENKYY